MRLFINLWTAISESPDQRGGRFWIIIEFADGVSLLPFPVISGATFFHCMLALQIRLRRDSTNKRPCSGYPHHQQPVLPSCSIRIGWRNTSSRDPTRKWVRIKWDVTQNARCFIPGSVQMIHNAMGRKNHHAACAKGGLETGRRIGTMGGIAGGIQFSSNIPSALRSQGFYPWENPNQGSDYDGDGE